MMITDNSTLTTTDFLTIHAILKRRLPLIQYYGSLFLKETIIMILKIIKHNTLKFNFQHQPAIISIS